MTTFLFVIHCAACLLLILLVMLQPDRGDGMAGAFGGMGGSVAFGVKTLDVLWKVTIVVAAVFMLTALALTFRDKARSELVPPPRTAAPASAPATAP